MTINTFFKLWIYLGHFQNPPWLLETPWDSFGNFKTWDYFLRLLEFDHSGKNTRLFACNQPTKKLANANLFIQHNCFYSPVKKFSNYLPKVNILGSNRRIFLRSQGSEPQFYSCIFCLKSVNLNFLKGWQVYYFGLSGIIIDAKQAKNIPTTPKLRLIFSVWHSMRHSSISTMRKAQRRNFWIFLILGFLKLKYMKILEFTVTNSVKVTLFEVQD